MANIDKKQIDRIKQLFTEERLYGNLVDPTEGLLTEQSGGKRRDKQLKSYDKLKKKLEKKLGRAKSTEEVSKIESEFKKKGNDITAKFAGKPRSFNTLNAKWVDKTKGLKLYIHKDKTGPLRAATMIALPKNTIPSDTVFNDVVEPFVSSYYKQKGEDVFIWPYWKKGKFKGGREYMVVFNIASDDDFKTMINPTPTDSGSNTPTDSGSNTPTDSGSNTPTKKQAVAGNVDDEGNPLEDPKPEVVKKPAKSGGGVGSIAKSGDNKSKLVGSFKKVSDGRFQQGFDYFVDANTKDVYKVNQSKGTVDTVYHYKQENPTESFNPSLMFKSVLSEDWDRILMNEDYYTVDTIDGEKKMSTGFYNTIMKTVEDGESVELDGSEEVDDIEVDDTEVDDIEVDDTEVDDIEVDDTEVDDIPTEEEVQSDLDEIKTKKSLDLKISNADTGNKKDISFTMRPMYQSTKEMVANKLIEGGLVVKISPKTQGVTTSYEKTITSTGGSGSWYLESGIPLDNGDYEFILTSGGVEYGRKDFNVNDSQ
jgi:hypothetical protein